MAGKLKEFYLELMKILMKSGFLTKTRHACDGLLNQRLDTPFVKYKNGKFDKASWKEVYKYN